jgi:mitochondrial pyruvate carrier 2
MAFGLVPKLQNYIVNRYSWPPAVKKYLESAGGPFTVFFWCPWMKWGIVIANIKDLEIPAQNISTGQQMATALTGLVWSRYATQIYPFNLNLLLVNSFMAITGFYQLYRKL